MKQDNKIKKLVTHNGRFHADDVFATATLELVLAKHGEEFAVTRTRDEDLIHNADYVYDVGGVHDPETNRFDHHQAGGAGKRENGIEYASIGLVWKKFGVELSGSQKVAEIVERRIITPIDADDNGIEVFTVTTKDVKPYTIQSLFKSFMPSLKYATEENLYVAFLQCVELAKNILQKEIARAADVVEAEGVVLAAYQEATDKRIIVIKESVPWADFIDKFPEPFFVVFPRIDGRWGVNAIAVDSSSFERRKNFPVLWAGLRDEELAKISGVPDAIFCHRKLFMSVAESKEGAIKLAQIALES